MKLLPVILIIMMAFACHLSGRLKREHVITNAETIRDAETKYYIASRKYASLEELVKTGAVEKELEDGKDSGFFIELVARQLYYTLKIYPDYSQGVVDSGEQEQLSMYCDETGILRASVNPNKRADKNSSEMHPKH